ncbi:ABC transporter ATP-binding protein [Herbidospora cretacea]|uniref:ABC transporter ATP-binding protein n=1 Tax=Herbidospora cretacea TaxID=28444 RepID=UPI0004C334C8|nr:ABC transporter ATP-binding protein [Herbidospora cretacea]
MTTPLLRITDLVLESGPASAPLRPVSHVGFEVAHGEAFGLVGESGSGKSLTLRAVTGLLPEGVRQVGGTLELERDGTLRPYRFAEARGRGIGMVFQEPMTALNPTMRIGDLVTAGPRARYGWSRRTARRRAVDLLAEVGMPDPEAQARMWPHQLSGGLRQRVMIAMALATEPSVLLCDEPTTALDVAVQDQILRLLHRIRTERGLSIVFVTHDLGVVRRLCDRVAVMYAGQVVETGRVDEVFTRPTHPYSAGLLRSMPTPDTPRDRPLAAIPGGQPPAGDRPEGCRFAPRCAHALPACAGLAHTLARVPGSPSRSACLRVADLGGPPLDRKALIV